MSNTRDDKKTGLHSRRVVPLRWHLVLLVAGTMLPVVLFAATVVFRLSQQERAASERRISRAAAGFGQIVEQEMVSTITTLRAMAESQELDRANLRGFYSEAQRVMKTQPGWMTVILASNDGRQLLNTRQPYGASLPPVNEPESLKRTLQTGQPAVGDLALGNIRKRWAFPVRVPVIRKGQIRYVLTAVITPQALAKSLEAQSPTEGEWTRVVVDGRGIIVARSRHPERFVGKSATPDFVQLVRQAKEGFYKSTTLEGVQVYGAFVQVGDSPWRAAVAVPVEVLDGPTRRAIALIIGIGFTLLLTSAVGALVLARQIASAIGSATHAAEALSQGQMPRVQHTSIAEVATLGKALESSAELLAQRAHERDQHLARAEAARAQAEAASHLKDEFLITISHELRTPLNAILGWASLLKSGQLDADATPRALEIIERNSRALSRLVDDLLDMSRIITGKLRIDPHLVDLTSVISGAVDSIRPAAEAKEITLSLHLSPTGPVHGDQSRLQQVVWNLLSNAVKFTPKGGQIHVSLAPSGSHAEITVRDSGIGIAPEFLPHVFDRFRQADGSTTRKFGGLGLGLAIVRQLVELHGGTVHVDSEGEEKGAIFSVLLPMAAPIVKDDATPDGIPPTDNAAAAPGVPQLLEGTRILVVDDDLDARTLMATVLAQQGAEVRACSSASEAFSEVTTWKPAVIVSDIGMPQQDGYEFIRMVREWEVQSGEKIPAAALTALARPEDRARALASGYQIHIPKPVEPDTLTDAVSSLLKDHH